MGALVFFWVFLGYSENVSRDFDKRGWVVVRSSVCCAVRWWQCVKEGCCL
jgi:hypothetical protein